MKKKLLSILLCICMLSSMLPVYALAAEGETCVNHPKHDGECGFVQGSECAWEHGDCCRQQTNCIYVPDEAEGEEAQPHECSEASGCITTVCSHVCSAELCGFIEAQPCQHSCEVCAGEPEEPKLPDDSQQPDEPELPEEPEEPKKSALATCEHHPEHTEECGGINDEGLCTNVCADCVSRVQAMVNALPGMSEINDSNRDSVVAQMDAISAELPHLSDRAVMSMDMDKFSMAALALSAPGDWFRLAVQKRMDYPEDGFVPSFSFVDASGAPACLVDVSSGAALASIDLVPNGGAEYYYLPAGTYTVIEHAEGYSMSLNLNGQDLDGTSFTGAGGGDYSLAIENYRPSVITLYPDFKVELTTESAIDNGGVWYVDPETEFTGKLSAKNGGSLPPSIIIYDNVSGTTIYECPLGDDGSFSFTVPLAYAQMTIYGKGEGSVSIDDWTEGETAAEPVVTSSTNDVTNATIEYKPAGADDSTYSDVVPTPAGKYTVRATVAYSNGCYGFSATDDFEIKSLALPTMTLTVSDSVDYNGSEQKPSVTVTSGGNTLTEGIDYQISYTRDGTDTSDFTNAGKIDISVTGLGSYAGASHGGNYVINKIDPNAADFLFTPPQATLYSGAPIYATIELVPSVVGMGDITVGYYKDGSDTAGEPCAAGKYLVKLTLSEGSNYQAGTVSSSDWAFEITKHKSKVTVPTGLTAIYGDSLKDISLSAFDVTKESDSATAGTWSWMEPTAPVGNVGTWKHLAVFTPANGDKYATAEELVSLQVQQKEISFTATLKEREYDGGSEATLNTIDFSGLVGGEALALGTDYEAQVDYYADGNVGTDKTATVTVTLKNTAPANNYKLTVTEVQAKGNITKAPSTAAEAEIEVLNGLEKSYQLNLSSLLPLLGDGLSYGDVSFELKAVSIENGYYDEVKAPAEIKDGVLSLPIAFVDSDTEGKLGTVTVAISTANYEFADSVIDVIAKNKPVLSLSAGTAQNAVYDGKAHTGYSQAPSSQDYTGTLEISYSGTMADGSSYGPTAEAPVKAGSYLVSFSVPADDPDYRGSAELSFDITKAPLTISADNALVAKGYTGSFTCTVEGLVQGDSLVTQPVINVVGGSLDTVGIYTLTPSGADAGSNYEISYTSGTVYVSADGKLQYSVYLAPLSSVPGELQGLMSLERIKTVLSSYLYTYKVYYYDAILSMSVDGTNWVEVPDEFMPAGGVQIVWPYQVDASKNSFKVAHMFAESSELLGTVAGGVEVPYCTETSAGLAFTLKSCSPLAIGYRDSSIVYTGDSSDLMLWMLLMAGSLGGVICTVELLRMKKRKS